ncbi:MAG TPA: Hpt domain-containing protein [Gammaproteobacteria bacterium]|nr:Hpt domain-containing protein [Gammaproteobacteria bacterium]
MQEQEQAIRSAFAAEARERLAKARGELDAIPGNAALDRLHQEFDSLHGAARAVNCRNLERLSRAAAEFARWLRREPGRPTPAHVELLQQGITLMEHAAGVRDGCEREDLEADILHCLGMIRDKTERGTFGRGE